MKSRVKRASLIAALIAIFGAGVFFINESTAQQTVYKVGERGPAGGWIFYDKGKTSDGWRYLEAAPDDLKMEAKWGCLAKSIAEARNKAIGTGKSNTEAIIKNCGESGLEYGVAKVAAKAAGDYQGGGKNDWFLPSFEELKLMYKVLHKKGIGGFAKGSYWSSSEADESYGWGLNFKENDTSADCPFKEGYDDKVNYHLVRAVRAF